MRTIQRRCTFVHTCIHSTEAIQHRADHQLRCMFLLPDEQLATQGNAARCIDTETYHAVPYNIRTEFMFTCLRGHDGRHSDRSEVQAVLTDPSASPTNKFQTGHSMQTGMQVNIQ
jgi:hypothetical protein